MITVRGQQFHFTKSGHIWLRVQRDVVLPRGLRVALIFGKLFVNYRVTAEKQKEGALCFDWLL